MPLNELNKSRGMLVRNLFGKGKRINECKGRRKRFEGKGGEWIPKTKKNKILEIILYYIGKGIYFRKVWVSSPKFLNP